VNNDDSQNFRNTQKPDEVYRDSIREQAEETGEDYEPPTRLDELAEKVSPRTCMCLGYVIVLVSALILLLALLLISAFVLRGLGTDSEPEKSPPATEQPDTPSE